MLVFSTQFPVASEASAGRLLTLGRTWLLGSPHTSIQPEDWPTDAAPPIAVKKEHEQLDALMVESPLYVCVGFCYQKREDDLRWRTVVVGTRDASRFWISVQNHCDSSITGKRLPKPKKPYIVRQIISEFQGGFDGPLMVQDAPHYVTETDIPFLAKIMSGQNDCLMPIVYASAQTNGSPAFDVTSLAQWLGGMAHVLVEPDRGFSFLLQSASRSKNVYGGATAIYWPEGIGQKIFWPWRSNNPMELAGAIASKVEKSLIAQRSIEQCTWEHLQSLHNQNSIEELKKAGNVKQYVDTFDDEIRNKQQQLEKAANEIARLKSMLQKRQAGTSLLGRPVLTMGAEQDVYEGETRDILLDVLKCAIENMPSSASRRRHLLEGIITNNPPIGRRGEILRELQSVLNDYVRMDIRARRVFEDSGFTFEEDGKHHKLKFGGDDRYPVILPKSGSDHRGGKNQFSQIRTQMF